MIGMFNKYKNEILASVNEDKRQHVEETVQLVDITNAAHWFYEESEQDYWDWTEDFPCIISPWPVAWFEHKSPRFIRSATRGKLKIPHDSIPHCGVLSLVHEIPEEARDKALLENILLMRAKMQAAMLGAYDFLNTKEFREGEEESNELARMQHEAGRRARWMCDMLYFVVVRKKIHQTIKTSFLVDDRGSFIDTKCLLGLGHDLPLEMQQYLLSSMEIHNYQGLFLPYLFAISLLHCKNVIIIDSPPTPKKIIKKRQKKGKPTIRYKQLVVKSLRKQVIRDEDENGLQCDPIQKALHICRGHFKDYRDGGGLFGRYHDIYWWDMHVRGTETAGKIIKNYKVVRSDIS